MPRSYIERAARSTQEDGRLLVVAVVVVGEAGRDSESFPAAPGCTFHAWVAWMRLLRQTDRQGGTKICFSRHEKV